VSVTKVGAAVVGQKAMIDRLLIGLLTGGHVLLEGVPGLAKTLAVSSLAKDAVRSGSVASSSRPTCYPRPDRDAHLQPKEGTFSAKKGPLFSNIVLADEVNRAPAKVQSALLEAMQEKQVTLGDDTHPSRAVPRGWRRRPDRARGTYPLPEAQSDRFMLKVKVGYPERSEEKEILRRAGCPRSRTQVAGDARSRSSRHVKALSSVYVDDKIQEYVLDLVSATAGPRTSAALENLISNGASPRGDVCSSSAAPQGFALIRGAGPTCFPDDVKAVALDVLRHRIQVSYEAEARASTARRSRAASWSRCACPDGDAGSPQEGPPARDSPAGIWSRTCSRAAPRACSRAGVEFEEVRPYVPGTSALTSTGTSPRASGPPTSSASSRSASSRSCWSWTCRVSMLFGTRGQENASSPRNSARCSGSPRCGRTIASAWHS